jgi:hypothetical protein
VWDIFWVFFSVDHVKEIPPLWEHHLRPNACICIAKGWMKTFFVVVLTTCSDLGAYSNFLTVPREECSPVSGSFIFGALKECLLVGFIGDIVPLQLVKNWLF